MQEGCKLSSFLTRVGSKDALVFLAFAVLVIYTIFQWAVGGISLVSILLLPILSITAVVSAIMAVAVTGVRRSRLSIVWFSFMVGLLLWFLSEVVWAIYPLILKMPLPAPSAADILGLGGYVPVLFGLGVQVWPYRENLLSKRILLAVLATIVLALLAFSALIPAVLSTGGGSWALIKSFTYPVFDLTTLVLAVPILILFSSGTFWRPFLFLVFGLVLGLTGHLLTSLAELRGVYSPGNPIDLLLVWAYFSAALGFYLMRKKMKVKTL
jgi:hypothetical protein